MQIAAVQSMTLLDYPKKLAAIVWTPGCNLRCGYCHNPELVLPERIAENRSDLVPEEAFFDFLGKRVGKLDGVVICGGEPTLHHDLEAFIRRIKSLGFLVKLDTNGSHPDRLATLLSSGLLDYVAMDVKHELHRYGEITPVSATPSEYARSIELIIRSGIDHEFRTTVIGGIHDTVAIGRVAETIAGCQRYTLQGFRPGTLVDSSFSGGTPTSVELLAMRDAAQIFVREVKVLP